MLNRKLVIFILALTVIVCGVPIAYADGVMATSTEALQFEDMPSSEHWSHASLQAAVDNGLLSGFSEGGHMYIKSTDTLTRAQMAAIVNRAFGAASEADLSSVRDVPSYEWFAQDMARGVKMKTFMLDTLMRPADSITRQEAFVVLARAFKLKNTDTAYSALNAFSDKADIASWALGHLNAMAKAGYINGSGGKLAPAATITRAEFAKVMDNMVKQYIDEAGTYTSVVASGNIIIRVSDVILDGVTVNGDLVVADGVGDGDATFNNVKIIGRAVIRGGGENSIRFTGSATDVPNIVIARGDDGKVRIYTEDGVVLAEAEVDSDGEVILDGSFGNVVVESAGVKVTLNAGTTVTSATISGEGSTVTLNEGSTITTATVSGQNVSIGGTGSLGSVTVATGGSNASITTPNTQITVAPDVSGVTAGGGTPVDPGDTVENNDEGNDVVEEEPIAGGGGGGGATVPTPVLSITEVTASGTSVIPVAGLYLIPGSADENNTAIDIEITNTAAVNYGVTLTIDNANDQTVAFASSTGLDRVYVDALSLYDGVTFVDISRMFDRLGTSPSGYYLNASGVQVNGSTLSAFEDSVTAAFDRMSNGEIYTVTVTLTPVGGSAGSLTFYVQKIII